MKINFVKTLPDDGSGVYAHYSHRRSGGSRWSYCDVRRHVYDHQDLWFGELEAWHSRLSALYAQQSKFWWFLPGSRLIAFHPPIYKPLFFAIALIELGEKDSLEEIYVLDCPPEVHHYLEELRPEAQFTVCPDTRKRWATCCRKDVGHSLRKRLKTLKSAFLLLARVISRNKRGTEFSNPELIVYSHVLDATYLEEKGDHFFGKMFDHLPDHKREKILWMTYPENKNHRQAYRSHYQSRHFNYNEIYDFLRWTDVKDVLITAFGLGLKLRSLSSLPGLRLAGFKSHHFVKMYFNETIRCSPITELAVYFAFKRCLTQIDGPVSVLYPYEEKGIDRAILTACRECRQPVQTYGFAHAVYNKGLLYVRTRPGESYDPPRPRKILATGPLMRKWFIEWGQNDSSKIDIIGSPRFHDSSLIPKDFSLRHRALRVLFLTGFGSELGLLANYVEERRDIFEGCELVVRCYEFAWSQDQKEGLDRLKKLWPSIKVEHGHLKDQIEWCDVAMYCSTSAGIEAMLCGRLTINTDLHDILDLNPLEGKGDLSPMYYCQQPARLRDMIRTIQNMTAKEYNEAVRRQREFAVQLFSPVESDRLGQTFPFCS